MWEVALTVSGMETVYVPVANEDKPSADDFIKESETLFPNFNAKS